VGGGVARHRAGLQALDMPAQGRGRRDPEDEVDPVGATPGEDLRATIMAVSAQQDLRLRPGGADGPEQPAQEGADVRPLRALGGAQHGGDKAALAIEDDEGLEPVLVVVGIEQAQLLAPMHGVEGVVDIEPNPLGHLPEGCAVQVDHRPPHPQQGSHVGLVLQTRDGGLRTELSIRRREVERHLEQGIAPQVRGVVAVRVAGCDHQQAKADDVGQSVGDLIGCSRIFDAGGEPIGDPQALLDLAQRQHPTVGRQQPAVELGHHRLAGHG